MIPDPCFLAGNYAKHVIDSTEGYVKNINDAISCQKKCQEVIECKFWTYNSETKICYRQTASAPEALGTCITCTRGPRNCPSSK